MDELLSAFKGGSVQEEDGVAQYKIMIESAKKNEKKLEPHVGDKIIGTMFIMVRAHSVWPLQDTVMNMYPANVPKKMADDWKERERIENWGSWLTEAVLRGEADI